LGRDIRSRIYIYIWWWTWRPTSLTTTDMIIAISGCCARYRSLSRRIFFCARVAKMAHPRQIRGTRRALNDPGMGVRGEDIEECALPLCRAARVVCARQETRCGLPVSFWSLPRFVSDIGCGIARTEPSFLHSWTTSPPPLPTACPCTTPISHCYWPSSPGNCRQGGGGQCGRPGATAAIHDRNTRARAAAS
jgi:hypothetical protein